MSAKFGWAANRPIIEKMLSNENILNRDTLLTGQDAVSWLEALERREISSQELVSACLQRMLKLEGHLNAMISINPNALETARECDRLRAEGCRKPLLGLPVVVKDNIDVDGFPTTLAAAALAESSIKQDAFLVRQLRDDGAVIIGKTNLSEYASDGMSDNTLVGQAHNPYDLTRTPGGSSGGSGIAAAVEYAAAGIGTDGVNSVRSPASANSLVGLRPTKGLVSCSGASPSSFTQDMCGILARSARDAALFLNSIAKFDPEDSTAIKGPQTDYFMNLDSNALSGRKIALLRNNCGDAPEVLRVVNDTVLRLREYGVNVVEIEDDVLDVKRMLAENNVIRFEQKASIDSWLADERNGYKVKSLKEYLDSGLVLESIRPTLLSEFDPMYADEQAHQERLKRIRENREYVTAKMESEGIDAFCYPMQSIPVVPIKHPKGQSGRNGILASALGLPAITFPGGYTQATVSAPRGIPIGMEFLGAALSEQLLLNLVHSYEIRAKIRRSPDVSYEK